MEQVMYYASNIKIYFIKKKKKMKITLMNNKFKKHMSTWIRCYYYFFWNKINFIWNIFSNNI